MKQVTAMAITALTSHQKEAVGFSLMSVISLLIFSFSAFVIFGFGSSLKPQAQLYNLLFFVSERQNCESSYCNCSFLTCTYDSELRFNPVAIHTAYFVQFQPIAVMNCKNQFRRTNAHAWVFLWRCAGRCHRRHSRCP